MEASNFFDLQNKNMVWNIATSMWTLNSTHSPVKGIYKRPKNTDQQIHGLSQLQNYNEYDILFIRKDFLFAHVGTGNDPT